VYGDRSEGTTVGVDGQHPYGDEDREYGEELNCSIRKALEERSFYT